MYREHGRSAEFGKGNIHCTFVRTNKSTIAEVYVDIDNDRYFGTGASHRVGNDEKSQRTGDLLAVTRAVERLHAALDVEAKKIH